MYYAQVLVFSEHACKFVQNWKVKGKYNVHVLKFWSNTACLQYNCYFFIINSGLGLRKYLSLDRCLIFAKIPLAAAT